MVCERTWNSPVMYKICQWTSQDNIVSDNSTTNCKGMVCIVKKGDIGDLLLDPSVYMTAVPATSAPLVKCSTEHAVVNGKEMNSGSTGVLINNANLRPKLAYIFTRSVMLEPKMVESNNTTIATSVFETDALSYHCPSRTWKLFYLCFFPL